MAASLEGLDEVQMNFYDRFILPKLVDLSMRNRHLIPYRQRVVGAAEGRVLEIGVGSGKNLRFYSAKASEVFGLEPSAPLVAMAESAARKRNQVRLIEGSAEAIPLDDRSVDTVVMTWTLCTIPDANRALAEMRRVLRPNGRLLFVEHGLSPDANVRKWQDRLTPAWRRISGGCHLNRPIEALIRNAGFAPDRIETGYMRGLKPMTFMYEGSARPS
jgi:ubiquinone/menaquinone biosynthesis C-methylase UbiE